MLRFGIDLFREELSRRRLNSAGSKEELVQRLETDIRQCREATPRSSADSTEVASNAGLPFDSATLESLALLFQQLPRPSTTITTLPDLSSSIAYFDNSPAQNVNAWLSDVYSSLPHGMTPPPASLQQVGSTAALGIGTSLSEISIRPGKHGPPQPTQLQHPATGVTLLATQLRPKEKPASPLVEIRKESTENKRPESPERQRTPPTKDRRRRSTTSSLSASSSSHGSVKKAKPEKQQALRPWKSWASTKTLQQKRHYRSQGPQEAQLPEGHQVISPEELDAGRVAADEVAQHRPLILWRPHHPKDVDRGQALHVKSLTVANRLGSVMSTVEA
ncbi:hypothetical protein HPB52_004212 [Rhipicephalus sanguineus]|uniref:SAP domain-containing protein n=1 Tax=Rhipicephalus sanguineus TaxID=34632 RepID=A0A9D4Q4K3_RHISA|nr:hypothetical protein HPB52_004212 [Rhipicephalus sanguineus]